MKRRDFLKTTSLIASSFLFPSLAFGGEIDLSGVNFDRLIHDDNDAKTIVFFMYGGPSELGANLTNLDEINQKSANDYYDYFGTVTKTANNFWKEAGGEALERMLVNEDVNIFRTCYSELREKSGNRSHGKSARQTQTGRVSEGAGIFSVLAKVLHDNGVVTTNSKLPFITFDGEPYFSSTTDISLPNYLQPVSLYRGLDNPYDDFTGDWYYATTQEHSNGSPYSIIEDMNRLSLENNPAGKLAENFKQREVLKKFIKEIKDDPLPEGIAYPDSIMGITLKNAVKIMLKNPDTKVITAGSHALGTWDEHNHALYYVDRMKETMEAIEIAMAHIKSANKEGKINIMLFGEFGRGVNLNDAKGWDHGNNQNLFLFGGKDYFNRVGIVGETYVRDYGRVNRLYTQPKSGSYWFEPYSIASTIYKMYGITNPEILTGGHGAIEAGLLKI